MAIVEYGGTVIEALSTDDWPEKPDGWFLKALDTGESYIRRDGEWCYINLGLAFIRATKSGRVTTDDNGEAMITFNTPFVDDQYSTALSSTDVESPGAIVYWYDRQATGFKIRTRMFAGPMIGNIEVSWLCTRDYNP